MGDVGQYIARISLSQYRIEKEAIVHAVPFPGRLRVLRAIPIRQRRREVQRQRELLIGCGRRAQRCQRRPVRQQLVVRGDERGRRIDVAGGMDTAAVAEESRTEWFIDRGPLPDAVSERPVYSLRVRHEILDELTGTPATVVLERLWQVPVIQSNHRLDLLGV